MVTLTRTKSENTIYFMRIYFEITAGALNRSGVRTQLNNSKEKLKYWYPECRVLLTETKDWLQSKFYFEANDIPDESEPQMREWISRIKRLCD